MIYFDNAASSKRPKSFIEVYFKFFENPKLRTRKEEKTLLLELSRKIASFLSVDLETISFVPNATYALNEIAHFLSNENRKVFLTTSEHSSNHVIWLHLFKDLSYFDLEKIYDLELPKDSAIFSISILSNLEGKEISLDILNQVFASKKHTLIIDGSQSIQHKQPCLKNSPADFFIFSAHKFFGPNGLGIIYSRDKVKLGINYLNYDEMFDNYELDYNGIEAWLNSIDEVIELFKSGEVERKERELNEYFVVNFPANDFVDLVNKDTKNLIFLLRIKSNEISAHDFSFYLAKNKVIVRSGLSCAWIAGERLDSTKVIRVSLNVFNTVEEIQYLFSLIKKFKIIDIL